MRGQANRGRGVRSVYLKAALLLVAGFYFLILVPSKVNYFQILKQSEELDMDDSKMNSFAKSSIPNYQWGISQELDDTLDILGASPFTAGIGTGNTKENVPVSLWSTDFHIAPIADLKLLLTKTKNSLNSSYSSSTATTVKVIDRSLSGHCGLTDSCAEIHHDTAPETIQDAQNKVLHVLNRDNGLSLGQCPNKMRRRFYEYYKNSSLAFTDTDAVVCTYSNAMCELYMPFNKSLIVITATRYEVGRGEAEGMYDRVPPTESFSNRQEEQAALDTVNMHYARRWQQLNENLRRMARRSGGKNEPFHIIAANNLYDKLYLEYFTGINNVMLLPSLASHVSHIQWNHYSLEPELRSPDRFGSVLLAPSRIPDKAVLLVMSAVRLHNEAKQQQNTTQSGNTSARRSAGTENLIDIVPIREKYPGHFEYTDLARHPAVVLLPYQVSIMSFFEYYRMGIPIYAPSAELLSQWHVDFGMLEDRSWAGVRKRAQSKSMIPRYDCDNGQSRYDGNTSNRVLAAKETEDIGIEVDKDEDKDENDYGYGYAEEEGRAAGARHITTHRRISAVSIGSRNMGGGRFRKSHARKKERMAGDSDIEDPSSHNNGEQDGYGNDVDRGSSKRSKVNVVNADTDTDTDSDTDVDVNTAKEKVKAKDKTRERSAESKAKQLLFEHDPNNEFEYDAVLAWVRLSDYYTWPNVVLFDSPSHLAKLLGSSEVEVKLDREQRSIRMRQFMKEIQTKTSTAWENIVMGLRRQKERRGQKQNGQEEREGQTEKTTGVNAALKRHYGYELEGCFEEKEEL